MKRPKWFILLLLVSACSNSNSVTGPTSSCSNSQANGSRFVPRNIWAWRSSKDILNSATDQADFFSFAESHAIKTVYVSVRTMLEKYGTINAETDTESNLALFLNTAQSKCMDVQLLIGNSGSYLNDTEAAADYSTMTGLAQNAKSYISGLSGAKPVAIHWDVEPQALGDWSANKQTYVQRLVNAFEKTRTVLSGSGIKQAADLPHWWDNAVTYGATSCDPSGNTSLPQYTNQIAHQCLIRVLDQIDLMDYRDSSILSINQASDEITDAGTILNFSGNRTPIVIGQEVSTNADLTLTFNDEVLDAGQGTLVMEIELQAIQNHFNSSIGFAGAEMESVYSASSPNNSLYSFPQQGPAGISLHHYEAYSDASVIQNFP